MAKRVFWQWMALVPFVAAYHFLLRLALRSRFFPLIHPDGWFPHSGSVLRHVLWVQFTGLLTLAVFLLPLALCIAWWKGRESLRAASSLVGLFFLTWPLFYRFTEWAAWSQPGRISYGIEVTRHLLVLPFLTLLAALALEKLRPGRIAVAGKTDPDPA